MRRHSARSSWFAAALCVALACVALPSSVATSAEARVVVAGAARVPEGDVIVNQSITTSFDVTLKSSDPSALSTFLTTLYDPSSSNYHHYLSTAAFARRFGATDASVSALRTYFAGYGVRVGSLSKGRVVLHMSGTNDQISRAFATPVVTVRTPDGVLASQFRSPATLPVQVASGVEGISGLSTVVTPSTNIVRPRASARVTPGTCPSAGSSFTTTPNTLGGYTAQQQSLLYGFGNAWSKGDTGVGQTIATYELSTYDPADLAIFLSCYGLSPSISSVNVDGGPTTLLEEEATLDIEEAAVLAPGAAIDVYQGPNSAAGPTDVYQQIADDNTATIVSTSWGTCESDPTGDVAAEQPIFEQMAAQGQTVLSASGDNGSSDCYGITNNLPAVDDPSSQPFVTGVGGLTVSNISPLTETVWNSGRNASTPGAGGGGVSSLWSRPAWQVAPGIAASEIQRMVPDISAMADPATGFIEYYTGTASGHCTRNCGSSGWGAIGGTSIGAPLVSALVATAAQSCAVSRLGFINPSLYAMASTGFNDVTTGSNDLFNVGEYSAGVGYDMASGLGSPKPDAFIAGLCPAVFDATKSSFSVSSSKVAILGPGSTISATLHDTADRPLTNAQLQVTAVPSGNAVGGRLMINNDRTSTQSSGNAVSSVTTDATGNATFTVSTTETGPVTVAIAFNTKTIYSTTIDFTAAAPNNAPGRPSIAKLSAIVGGFVLVAKPPTSNGGVAISSYQYSINAGARWTTIAGGSTSVRVTRLVKGRRYNVVVRAINAIGASAASAAKSIVTRK